MPYKDPEVRRQKSGERYAKDPEKYKSKQYRWREENPERWKAIRRRAAVHPQPPSVPSEAQRRDRQEYQRVYRVQYYGKYTCSRLKRRAEELGVAFNLTPEDLVVPFRCPILGIALTLGGFGQRDDAPSVDRIRPELGYTKGNIRIISMKANRIRNDASIQELELVLEDMKRLANGNY